MSPGGNRPQGQEDPQPGRRLLAAAAEAATAAAAAPAQPATAVGDGELHGAATSDDMGVTCLEVDVAAWYQVFCALKEAGGRFDWLGAVDGSEIEVVALVRDDAEDLLIRTFAGSGQMVPSIREVFPGAAWHEREAADLVGVRFADGDPRPLLLHSDQPPPLRQSYPLTARLRRPWPGAAGTGRRSRIPGNNPQWQEPTAE